jgi:hypothetical protein
VCAFGPERLIEELCALGFAAEIRMGGAQFASASSTGPAGTSPAGWVEVPSCEGDAGAATNAPRRQDRKWDISTAESVTLTPPLTRDPNWDITIGACTRQRWPLRPGHRHVWAPSRVYLVT